MKNYRVGYATGRVVREIRKGAKRLGEVVEDVKKHVARKEAAKVQAGKDEIRKSDMGYATGGAIRVGKAFGGPSHSVRRAVKKILKKAKAKKDTESVRDVRAGGGAIRATARQIAKKIKAKKDTESVKDVR